jgi:hypothetical protein
MINMELKKLKEQVVWDNVGNTDSRFKAALRIDSLLNNQMSEVRRNTRKIFSKPGLKK